MEMSEEEFLALLTPERKAFILESVSGGYGDYDNPKYYGAEARRDHTPAVVAQIRNCHIVARAQRALVGRSDIRVGTKGRRVLFIIADRARVSFKKLDRRLRPRNYPTRQARNFLRQNLPGLDQVRELTNIVAGYRPDELDTGFEVHVVCPKDERNVWEIKLSGAEVVDFFSTPATPPATAPQPRVQIRPGAQKKRDLHGSGE
jgi:hypothetical protein